MTTLPLPLPLKAAQTTSTKDTVDSWPESLPRAYGTGSFTFLGDAKYAGYFFIARGRTSAGGIQYFPAGSDLKSGHDLSTITALTELRLKTGFTWDQLSRLFSVDRRSLHFWASGKPMSADHEEHLFALHALIQRIDRGSARANRAILISPLAGREQSPFDLLVAGKYEEVKDLLGSSRVTRKRAPLPSSEQLEAKLSTLPFVIDGDIDDSPLPTPGIYRASKRVRVNRGKSA